MLKKNKFNIENQIELARLEEKISKQKDILFLIPNKIIDAEIYPDTVIKSHIEIYKDFCSQKRFGRFYARAVALLIAHFLTLEKLQQRTLAEILAEDDDFYGIMMTRHELEDILAIVEQTAKKFRFYNRSFISHKYFSRTKSKSRFGRCKRLARLARAIHLVEIVGSCNRKSSIVQALELVKKLFLQIRRSPLQIFARLNLEKYSAFISYKTIYRAIYAGMLLAPAQFKRQ